MVALVNLTTYAQEQAFPSTSTRVNSLDVSPDGKQIVIASNSEVATVINLEAGNQEFELRGHSGAITSVQYSPGGDLILTGSLDTTSRLWDGKTGQLLRTLNAPTGGIQSLAFSPDGRMLLIGSDDQTARLWDVRYTDFVAYICQRLTRDFTPAERQAYALRDSDPTCPRFFQFTALTGGLIAPTWTPFPTPTAAVWTPIPTLEPTTPPTPSPTDQTNR